MAENNNSSNVNSENTPKSSRPVQNIEPQDKNKTENVLRPILLEEYKYEDSPESLQNLMKFFESHAVSQSRIDIVVGLIFLLMAETGFVPIDYNGPHKSYDFHYQRMMFLSKNPPLDWLSNRKSYTLNFHLTNLQQFETKLVIVSISDDLIVNCFVKGIESSFNTLIDPLTYFTSSNTNLKKIRFQHLDRLSLLIKNLIAFPVKCSILKQNNISFPCMEDLPPEVVLIIMKKLPLVDLVEFGNINGRYKYLTQDLFKKFGKKMQ